MSQIEVLFSRSYIFCILLSLAATVHAKCEMKDFMSCMVQLRAQNVIVNADIMTVVFNASSEAKLFHMCRSYHAALPCFRARVTTCGDDQLTRKLEEVSRLLLLLCSPFSVENQRNLLEVAPCVREMLRTPLQHVNCPSRKHTFSSKLDICRKNCNSSDYECQSNVELSQLAACSVSSLEEKCGQKASDFYMRLHTTMTGKEYPIQCDYGAYTRPAHPQSPSPGRPRKS